VPTPNDSLSSWLAWLERLHPTEIEMGLDRVGRVADRLKLRPAPMPVILVAGTNGKGSTVTLLADIYHAAGYTVGAYTSPHIHVFNERMSVNGIALSDQVIVNALHSIESARNADTLTYFEYTTLAAMHAFIQHDCDLAVLEVGLGGRLDATNLWDCDCAILTSIALDHQAYLGDTRELIAREKVAIGRSGKPLIVGEPEPPSNLADLAQAENMQIQLVNQNLTVASALAGEHQQRNAACALAAVDALQSLLPVHREAIEKGLNTVSLPGRFEVIMSDGLTVVLDVAHNPAAAETVAKALVTTFPDHQVFAVFSALNDKDIVGIVSALAPAVTSWYCAELSTARAMPLSELVESVSSVASVTQSGTVTGFGALADAMQAASEAARDALEPTIILVAGSFFALTELRERIVLNSDTHRTDAHQ